MTARKLKLPTLLQRVHDSWWPERHGDVIKVLKTRVHVQWLDGEVWVYDREHLKFLVCE